MKICAITITIFLASMAMPCFAEPVVNVYRALQLYRSDERAAYDKYGDISTWDIQDDNKFWRGYFKDDKDFNADISKWNVEQVTSMQNMFEGATSFNQDISAWNVAKLESTALMFKGATSFNKDLSTWDMSSNSNMNDMFMFASSFSQDVSVWNIQHTQVVDTFKNVSPDFPCNSVRSWPFSRMVGCTFTDTSAPTGAPTPGKNAAATIKAGLAATILAVFVTSKNVC